jgi:NADH-quinone oxidoreductase subunit L
MTVPLMVLAVGAVVAGFVGVPAALGGNNAIESFLHPSFVAQAVAGQAANDGRDARPPGQVAASDRRDAGPTESVAGVTEHGAEGEQPEMSTLGEYGLMAFSVFLGVLGILVALRFYVWRAEISERLAARFSGAHRVLTNKYYVDELYGATFVNGTLKSANGLWAVDRNVIDGAVNGSGWVTIVTAWTSGLIDKYIVDGLVNLVGWVLQRSSFVFRRAQTGLIQNYALMMLFGVFIFVTYLLLRN